MKGNSPLRVCIDARLQKGAFGGIEQVVIGLAYGLSRLTDGPEEYRFLVYPDADDWIAPYVGGSASLLHAQPPPPETAKAWARERLPLLYKGWHRFSPLIGKRAVPLERSDGTPEAAGANVMHFPTQKAFLTEIPSIYHPWDLQHLHLPQLFTPRERFRRDLLDLTFCNQAAVVAVAVAAVQRDVSERYGVPPEKIQVVPIAPATACYPPPTEDDLRRVRTRFALPERFAFYPGHTWPHKNHLALIEALAILRDRDGLRVPLVCSGTRTDFYSTIQARIRELRLEREVRFLDYVEPVDVRALYELCRCVVFPTKFEGWGMPLTEAFAAGKPAACSDIPPLREQAADAALPFNPDSVQEIADAVARVWGDEELRRKLAESGRQRAELFTWERTARIFRALYRRLGGAPLAEQDAELLANAAQPLTTPQPPAGLRPKLPPAR